MKLNKLCLATLFAFSSLSNAKIFEAKGIGDTPEQAKQDAITNAIKFSVGEFVVNKEELNNETFNQKVVGYSNAYVKKIDVLSQNRKESGEYESAVAVDIESQKLIGALKEMQVAVAENVVDSETLMEAINHFDKQKINKSTENNFKELAKAFLLEPALEQKGLVDIRIEGTLKPADLSTFKGIVPNEKYPFELNFSLTPNKEYIGSFKKILSESKPKQNEAASRIREINVNDGIEIKTHYLSNINFGLLKEVYSELITPYEQYGAINIILIDKENNEIKNIITQGYDDNIENISALRNNKNELFASRGLERKLLPNFFDGNKFFSGTLHLKAILFLTKDEVVNLKDIKIQFINPNKPY